jgi:diguanylate cyclase (GGDEF)-like protein
VEVNIPAKRPLIVILSVAGIVGSLLAAWDMKQAITLCQRLYSVDAVSLEVESDLEDDLEGGRRALLTELVATDVSGKQSALDEARAAGKRVQDGLRHLRSLNPPEVLRQVDQLERSWYQYEQVADEIFRHSTEGDSGAAIQAERANGQLGFGSTLLNLRRLKQGLEEHAKIDSTQVDATLKYSVWAFAEFGFSVLIILVALGKANQDRRRALLALQATHDALAVAKQVEQQRASVLEMVAAHAPLGRTLGAIAELPRKCGLWAGAAVWIANDADIQLQVAANIPDQLSDVLRAYSLFPKGDVSAQLAALSQRVSALARQSGLFAFAPVALRDGSERLIGVVQVFAREDMAEAIQPLAHHLEQLALVAIENTLLYERLAFQAQHDTLTELPNRLLFHDRLDQAIRGARRNRKKLAVMWIDLDRYKQINDSLGHRVGDELLCEVGRRLKACLRETDSVARVGGDEFTVLITELADGSDIEAVPAKIMHAISQPMSLDGHQISITASAGISLFPEHAEDAGALIRDADLAMYSAKQAGRSQYKIFRANLGAAAARRLEIERELRTALERHELSLVYQPLMKLDGELDGLEALLRWTNPALGEVGPAECIPIAEEMGLIVPIGEWVTRQACSDAARWLREGHELGRVAVNLSAIQCVDKNFGVMVERALTDFKLPPSKLEFEVTETALIRNLDKAIGNIEYLRKLGVRFAIDDFGTGYSSLSQLRTLPIDCVKIDRSFIKDLEYEGNGCTTMVRGIIGLAHNLKLEVVAEGIETEEQFTVLRSLGCDVNQGFYLHRPMSFEAVEDLLQKAPVAVSESLNLLAASTLILNPSPSPAV